MRKICFVSGVIARSGGTERVGSIIANSLSKAGYDVFLLTFGTVQRKVLKHCVDADFQACLTVTSRA